MVDCQIRPSKVTNENVLAAFLTVPREAFVGKSQRAIAYVDEDLPLPGGRNLMEPMILARLIQALEVRPGDSVLVVGAATGYEIDSTRSTGQWHPRILLRMVGKDTTPG